MEMSNKKQQIPAIRFNGFTDAWEHRTLGDITEVITKGTTPLDKSWKGPVNYVKTDSIDSQFGHIIVKANTSIEEHERYLKRSQLKAGDVLFSIVGTLGRVGIVQEKDLPANTNQQIAIIRLNKGDNNYVFNALKTSRVAEFIKSDATIGAQPSLSLWQIEKLIISYPGIKEQIQIGNFFNQLDNTIALHQRQLDNHKDLKKVMLQKLFPQNIEKIPEVRFYGFTEEWELHKLGEYFKKYQNTVYLQDDVDYTQVSVRNTGVIECRGTKKGKSIGRKRQYVIDTEIYPNTLTFTRQTIYEGGIGFVPEHLHGAIVTENMPLLSMNGKMNKYFAITMFETFPYFRKVIEKNMPIGSAQKALHEKVWLESELLIPNTEEQSKIGQFFKQLDDAINLHQQKLNEYQQVKKAMLQQMFV